MSTPIIESMWQCACCEMNNFANVTHCQACSNKRPPNQSPKASQTQHKAKKVTETKPNTDEELKSEVNMKQDVTLSLRAVPEFDTYPLNKCNDKFFFMTSIKAPCFRNILSDRTGIDLVCVIDESGSMDGDRIKLVKHTINFIINNLQDKDFFGCIAFSSTSRQILELTKMDEQGRKIAINACKNIKAHGRTNLCQGLIDGINMLQKRHSMANDVSSIFLFTDGETNEGTIKNCDIIQEIKNNNENNNGLVLSIVNTFGFGADHAASLLEEISNYGNGMYTFIKNVGMISSIFAEALGGLISVIGQKLKVRIEALNDIKINHCLSKGFKSNEIKHDKILEILIPDIQSEESRDLVFQLNINKMQSNKIRICYPIIKFSVEYMNVITQKKDFLCIVCTIDRILGKQIGERNIELDVHYNRLIAAQAMKNANTMAQNNDLEGARTMIQNVQRRILLSPSNSSPFCVDLINDLSTCNEGLVNHISYNRFGNQYITMNSNSLTLQRASSSISSPIQRNYSTTPRISMITKSESYISEK